MTFILTLIVVVPAFLFIKAIYDDVGLTGCAFIFGGAVAVLLWAMALSFLISGY